jgi:DNA-binding IscR family transcriptional regulator
MADSQRFHVAVHMLMLMGAKGADAPERAMTSGGMAANLGANPVVLRRVIAQLAAARLLATRTGAQGGVWLAVPPSRLRVEAVREAVGEGAAVCSRKAVNKDCPIAVAALAVIDDLSARMEGAVRGSLARLTLSDLIKDLVPA